MSVNTAVNYLIGATSTLATGYSPTLPETGTAVVYRALTGTTSKTLAKTRQYSTIPFNAIIRGGQDDAVVAELADDMVELLDMSTGTGIIQCNVTGEPQYAYTDDNENICYTFNLEVLV